MKWIDEKVLQKYFKESYKKYNTWIQKKYGEKQVLLWRRSYDIKPPELKFDDERHPRFENKYINIEPKKNS